MASEAIDDGVTGQSLRKVLHVGCGALTLAAMSRGFQDGSWREVRFDIDPNMSPDIIGTITDMSQVKDESVDAVYSSHNIEHVETFEVVQTLGEFRRVIKSDGFAAITCPDIESIAKVVVEGSLDQPLYQSSAGPISPLDVLYGFSADIQRGRHYMAHRTAFSAALLKKQLHKAGFASSIVARRPGRFDLWAIATKSATPEKQLHDMLTTFGLR